MKSRFCHQMLTDLCMKNFHLSPVYSSCTFSFNQIPYWCCCKSAVTGCSRPYNAFSENKTIFRLYQFYLEVLAQRALKLFPYLKLWADLKSVIKTFLGFMFSKQRFTSEFEHFRLMGTKMWKWDFAHFWEKYSRMFYREGSISLEYSDISKC